MSIIDVQDLFDFFQDAFFNEAGKILLDWMKDTDVPVGDLSGRVEQPIPALWPCHDGDGAKVKPAVQDEAGEADDPVLRPDRGELDLADLDAHRDLRSCGLPG